MVKDRKVLNIQELLPFCHELEAKIRDEHGISQEQAYAILFDAKYRVKTVLIGDDARAFSQGEKANSHLNVSGHIFYDPYDMPELFYWGYKNLDLFSVLVSHGIISTDEYEKGDVPESWGESF